MPLQQILPTWVTLNASNDASASHITDPRTGQPIHAGGLNVGDYFDLTEKEANAHSYLTNGLLHWGRYRRIQVDPAANPAQLGIGKLGFMPTALIPEVNILTSQDHGVTLPFADGRARLVVFLNVITPGNYGFAQELGVVTMSIGGATAGGVGAPLYIGTNGDAVPISSPTGAGMAVLLAAVTTAGGLTSTLLDFPPFQG